MGRRGHSSVCAHAAIAQVLSAHGMIQFETGSSTRRSKRTKLLSVMHGLFKHDADLGLHPAVVFHLGLLLPSAARCTEVR
jgi:hypothetical protein